MNFERPPENKIENQEPFENNLKNIQEVFKLSPELENIAVEATKSGETISLYRIENKNIEKEPDGITSHKDLKGQWFSPDLETALVYLRKSQQTFGAEAKRVEGANLVVVKIPKEEFENLHVSKHPIASQMDVENDNYIVPENIERNYINLDDVQDKVGNFENLQKAKEQIKEKVKQFETKEAVELYREYLKTIFPESRYKEIGFKGVSKDFSEENKPSFYTKDLETAKHYSGLREGTQTISAVFNFKNPLIINAEKPAPIPIITPDGKTLGTFNDKDINEKIISTGYDGLILNRKFSTPLDGWEILSFNNESRHILGTESDIENFKNFTSKTEKFNEKDGYNPDVLNILNTAPNEIIELIKNKKYYHVTLSKFGEKILENGMRGGEKPIENSDLEYFEDLYKKYSKNRNDQFFQYHIKGIDKDKPDNQRGVHVSSNPDAKLYQVPESLKFYLANLFFLLNSGRLTPEEQTQVQSTFNKYYESIKTDKVSVLEINALDPAVLNSVLGGYDNLDFATVKQAIKSYEPNIEIKGSVLSKYIKIKEEKELNIEDLDKGIKNSGFIIF